MITRRQTLKSLAVSSGLMISGQMCAAEDERRRWPIAVFEKVFEGLSYEELADAMVQIGADGVEATIRPGGHIAPEKAAEEVPKMQSAMRQRGKQIVIAATHISSVDDPFAEQLLQTFQALGISHYRLGYYRLDASKPLKPQVANYAAQARDLAAMNQEIGIQGLYQNHSGSRYLGSLLWDLAYLLDDIDPNGIGIALDLRHMRADTGTSWKTAVQLARPHLRSIYVKDAVWRGPRSNELTDVPLDQGFVTDELFQHVRAGLSPMPLCLHVEHLGYRVFEKHEIPRAIEAHRQDIATLQRWMSS